ncbi:hypothetical protein ABMA28_009167 [Loxostege sticticalis]|uniref:snRNA-activating protein complex subunit 1 n=1 Tax=Loxostege sticticalis TaxID=481309 RepID=A0ABD0SCE3_LOXSC
MSIPHQQRITTHQIHQVHIADGFADDCEELIHRWLKTDMLTYETFCEIWKDMQFDLIFHGRPTGAELGEVSEEVINIAKHYMVTNPDNFEESVAGLFLVYALLNLQPYPGFAALRIVPDDVPAITRIETMARASKRYDVLYILGSILTQGPVQFHAVARERGMESCLRKYLDGTTGIDRVGVRPKGVFYRQNEELDLLRELNNITRRYVEAKKNIPGSSKSLNYTNEKIATELDSSLKEIINGILEEGDEGNQKISNHYSTVQAIKEKAMRQTVDGVRFLSSAADRSQVTNPVPVLTKPPDKKPVKKAAVPQKRRCTIRANTYKYRNRKRKRPTYSSTSSSESLELSSDDHFEDLSQEEDSQDSQGVSDEDIEVFTDLNLDDLKTPKQTEKGIDISIEKLPVFIRSEQDGNLYEIEIIDEMNKGQKTVDRKTKITEVPIEILTQDGEGSSKETDSKNMAEISKIKLDNKEKVDIKNAEKKGQKKKYPKRNKPLEMPPIEEFGDNSKASSGKASNK